MHHIIINNKLTQQSKEDNILAQESQEQIYSLLTNPSTCSCRSPHNKLTFKTQINK